MFKGAAEEVDNRYGYWPAYHEIHNQQRNAEYGFQAVEYLQKRKVQHYGAQKEEYEPYLALLLGRFRHSTLFVISQSKWYLKLWPLYS